MGVNTGMIYIVLTEAEAKKANEHIKANLDREGGDTFVVNKIDKADKDAPYCLISLPDNGSVYVEEMKKLYGYTDFVPEMYNTRKITKAQATATDSKDAKIGKKDKSVLIAALSDKADAVTKA